MMRSMSLHGLSHDASGAVLRRRQLRLPHCCAGLYKCRLTDIAASIGLHQLQRAEAMRQTREQIAQQYYSAFASLGEVELPPVDENRLHSWHLYPLKLRLDQLDVSRNAFLDELKQQGVGCSVHWRPLHLHPYYKETYGWQPGHLPVASTVWERLLSLPIFSSMRAEEVEYVCEVVRQLCARYSRQRSQPITRPQRARLATASESKPASAA
ncbi:MAG: DegT/DnrJ/EryC1/StrS family aminotransferase [Blastocatellia bacterium]